jgi:predicted Zn finger-like uncharacterized protein
MPETIQCPQCRRALQIQEAHLGKRVRCPSCQTVFEAVPVARPAPDIPVAEERVRSVSEWEVPEKGPGRRRRRLAPPDDFRHLRDDDELLPHRGGMILVWGILSIALSCAPLIGAIFGSLALNWASTDLGRMRRKTMDPSGRGQTRAGQVCGTIGLILSALFLILACLLRLTAR